MSEEVNGGVYVPLGERPEWADVKPVYHSDAETGAVSIAYSAQFAEVFAYFRAVLAAEEHSARALVLTTEAAWLNPANYTVWQFRRTLLQALGSNLDEELVFTTDIIQEYPKNYQVWYHRKMVVTYLKNASKELPFVTDILEDDAKNYHAWQHRHWVVKTYQMWEGELQFAHWLIQRDCRNNSAWNYRYFIIANSGRGGFNEAVLANEVDYALTFIEKATRNESAWNYLAGILIQDGLASRPEIWSFCERLYAAQQQDDRSCHLLAAMFDYLEDELLAAGRQKGVAAGEDQPPTENSNEKKIARAEELLDELVNTDSVRKKYWGHLKSQFVAKFRIGGADVLIK